MFTLLFVWLFGLSHSYGQSCEFCLEQLIPSPLCCADAGFKFVQRQLELLDTHSHIYYALFLRLFLRRAQFETCLQIINPLSQCTNSRKVCANIPFISSDPYKFFNRRKCIMVQWDAARLDHGSNNFGSLCSRWKVNI